MSFLNVDGAELYYELHGEGPALVLIHGASGTHLSWWQQVAELRAGHLAFYERPRRFNDAVIQFLKTG